MLFALNFAVIICSLTVAVPQALHLRRTGLSSGVSTSGWALQILNTLAWLLYGVVRARWGVAIAELVLIPAPSVLLAMLWRREAPSMRSMAGVAAWAAVLAAAVLAGIVSGTGMVPLGTLLSVAVAVRGVPMMRAAFASQDMAGVSATSLLLALALAGSLLGVGLLVDDVPYIESAVLSIATTLPVLARLGVLRARGVQAVPAVG